MHTGMYTYTQAHIHIHRHMHTHRHTHIYIGICTYTQAHAHAHRHMHIHTGTYTCTQAYTHFLLSQLYAHCLRKKIDVSALAKPLVQGALLLCLAAANKDHAEVENAKVKVISDLKLKRAEEVRKSQAEMRLEWKDLGFESVEEFDKYAAHPLFDFWCSHHKCMLLAEFLRKTHARKEVTTRECRAR